MRGYTIDCDLPRTWYIVRIVFSCMKPSQDGRCRFDLTDLARLCLETSGYLSVPLRRIMHDRDCLTLLHRHWIIVKAKYLKILTSAAKSAETFPPSQSSHRLHNRHNKSLLVLRHRRRRTDFDLLVARTRYCCVITWDILGAEVSS